MKKKSKKEISEMFGAKEFKKIVLKVEKIKWKIIKSLLPNYLKGMEKQFIIQRDKALKKAKNEDERKQIIDIYKTNIMIMRKEYYSEQNINYHLDLNNPERIKEYLKRNKSIHMKWLRVDLVLAPILITILGLGYTWAIPFIAIVGLETIKNFECINLQNYNLVCFEEKEEKLKRLSNKMAEQNRKKYGKAQDIIEKTIYDSKEVPKITKVIETAKSESPESIDQIIQLLKNEKINREKKQEEKEKVKVKKL